MFLWFLNLTRLAIRNLSFNFQRWHYSSCLWFLPCPQPLACFQRASLFTRTTITAALEHTLRASQGVGGGVGLALRALGVSVNLLGRFLSDVLPVVHGQTSCWSCETFCRNHIPKMPFDIHICLFLDLRPPPVMEVSPQCSAPWERSRLIQQRLTQQE